MSDEPVKTKKQIYFETIDAMPLSDEVGDIPDEFPIPLKNSVFVKQITGAAGEKMRFTKGGIMIVQSTILNERTVIPNMGIVMAVGIECSEYLRPGQKIIYNVYAEEKVMILGEEYVRLNEATDIYGILPPDGYVIPKQKDDRWLFREKRKKEFANYDVRKERHDQNVLDEKTEKKKGKKNLIILPGGPGGNA